MPTDVASPVAWWSEALPWIGIALFFAVVSGVVAAWLIHARARALERRLSSLDRLEELKVALDRLVATRADLDLRRTEHVLIDLRDGQRRLEERLLAVIESAHAAAPRTGTSEPLAIATTDGSDRLDRLDTGERTARANALAERIVTRLLALGYERIQLVTPVSELAVLADGDGGDGEVSIEARRDGAPCKGRIVVRRGRIADVQIQAAYSTFP